MLGRRLLHCSFCGKDETQVAKLVAGSKAYICDQCVKTAKEIMDSSKSPQPPMGINPERRG
jgi:ATP-dependent Clp protease ATP-binding subunit ClpX